MSKAIETLEEMLSDLNGTIEDLVSIREDVYQTKAEKWHKRLEEARKNLAGETSLLFIGEYSSGKSTFVNALLGQEILPTGDHPCTAVITEINLVKDGEGHRGSIFFLDKTAQENLSFEEVKRIIDGRTGLVGKMASMHHISLTYDISTSDCSSEEVPLPLQILESANIKLIDCPGFNSPYGLNERTLDEYISKATYTFWFSTADRFGGSFAKNKLSQIKRKTTTIIPLIAKSDLIIDEDQRRDIKDAFADNMGDMFHNKEPRFVSAKKLFESIEINKHIAKNIVMKKEEKECLTNKARQLEIESGVENVAHDIMNMGVNEVVTDKSIETAKYDIKEISEELTKAATSERTHWEKCLSEKGWTPNDNYAKLTKLRDDLSKWCEKQSDIIGGEYEAELSKRVSDYLIRAKNKYSDGEMVKIIDRLNGEVIQPWVRSASEHIRKVFQTQSELFLNANPNVAIPALNNLSEDLLNTIMSVLDATKYQTMGAAISVGLGYLLIVIAGGLPGTIATALYVVGALLGAAGTLPMVPGVHDAFRKRTEEKQQRINSEMRLWASQQRVKTTIKKILMDAINEIFDQMRIENDRDLILPLNNYETSKSILTKVADLQEKVKQAF